MYSYHNVIARRERAKRSPAKMTLGGEELFCRMELTLAEVDRLAMTFNLVGG